MTATVTQQTVVVGYSTDPKARVSTLAVELIRSINSSSLAATAQPVVFVATG